MEKNKKKRGSVLILGIFLILLMTAATLRMESSSRTEISRFRSIEDERKAIVGSDEMVSDGLDNFNSTPSLYRPYNSSACTQTTSLRMLSQKKYETGRELSISNILTNNQSYLGVGKIGNFLEGDGFVNRRCSIYTKGIPNKSDAAYAFHESDSFIDASKSRLLDENGFYGIGVLPPDGRKIFSFDSSQIKGTAANLVLQYNFTLPNSISTTFLGYGKELGREASLLKSTGNSVSKTNLYKYFDGASSVGNQSSAEIGIVSFSGDYDSGSHGYKLIPGTGRVEAGTIIVDGKQSEDGRKIPIRLYCPKTSTSCEIRNFDIEPGRVYVAYVRTFDKSILFRLGMTDTSDENLFLPSDNLYVQGYGFSRGKIVYREATFSGSAIRSNLISGMSSSSYDWVFFSSY